MKGMVNCFNYLDRKTIKVACCLLVEKNQRNYSAWTARIIRFIHCHSLVLGKMADENSEQREDCLAQRNLGRSLFIGIREIHLRSSLLQSPFEKSLEVPSIFSWPEENLSLAILMTY